MKFPLLSVLPLAAASVLLAGAPRLAADPAPVTAAIAVIRPTEGNQAAGIVTFTATDARRESRRRCHRSDARQTWLPYP